MLTLDEYEPIVTPLLKIIRTCYFGSSYEYRCLEADEAELIESCLDTLTVIIYFFITSIEILTNAFTVTANHDDIGSTQL